MRRNKQAKHDHAGLLSEGLLPCCGGVESRHATVLKEGVSYPESQANVTSVSDFAYTDKQAKKPPAGPRDGSRIETAGLAPCPQQPIPVRGRSARSPRFESVHGSREDHWPATYGQLVTGGESAATTPQGKER